MRFLLLGLAFALAASPVQATKSVDMKGSWACEPAPMLIRGEWTTLTYRIEIAEQRDHLFKGTFHWTMPEDKGVKGEKTSGERAYEGTWTALGVIGWDRTIEIVSLGGAERTFGTLKGKDTIRFVHGKTGDDAWVSRTVCQRQ